MGMYFPWYEVRCVLLTSRLVAAATTAMFEYAQQERNQIVAIFATILGFLQAFLVLMELVISTKNLLNGSLFPDDPVVADSKTK